MSLPGFFDALSSEHRETVAKLLAEVEFEPGTTIFTEGDRAMRRTSSTRVRCVSSSSCPRSTPSPCSATKVLARHWARSPSSTGSLGRRPRSPTRWCAPAPSPRQASTSSRSVIPAAALGVTQELARDATAKLRRLTEQALRPDVRRRARPGGRRPGGSGGGRTGEVRGLAGGQGRRPPRPPD